MGVNKVIYGNSTVIDISDTTAAAADVASGKYFYTAAGDKVQGTASGGGGGAVKIGALRPDAELWKSWTYDKKIFADEGITIPGYSTTAATLKAGAQLESVALSPDSYFYFVSFRGLGIPQYSDSSKRSGKTEYTLSVAVSEQRYVPYTLFKAWDGTVAQSSSYSWAAEFSALTNAYRTVYCGGTTSVRSTNNQYGPYVSHQAPTISSGNAVITAPNLMIRGASSYMSSTTWGYLTDLRYQYVIELWRVPVSSVPSGFNQMSQVYHILDCVNNNNGKLT